MKSLETSGVMYPPTSFTADTHAHTHATLTAGLVSNTHTWYTHSRTGQWSVVSDTQTHRHTHTHGTLT